jgi:predicted ArsR family transcriptional regulator
LTSLREHNRHRIIDVLRGAGAVSRAEIARRTGLSRSTVSSLVGELEDAGVVVEAANAVGVAHGTQGGRPPTLVSLDRSAGVAVGIDFGHSHLAVAVADLAHTVLAEARHDLDVDHEAAWGMRSAAELVGRLLAKAGVDRGQVLGVGSDRLRPPHAER